MPFDHKSLHDWVGYLHKASQAHKDDPNDTEAADAINQALYHIQSLQRGGQARDAIEGAQPLGAIGSTAAALAHGASLGTGEPIAGAMTALQGKGFRSGAQGYRDAMSDVEASHPMLSAGGELLGTAALGSPSAIARPLAARLGTSLIPRIAEAAATGGTMGAVQGFSEGGEDAGDLGGRGIQALKSGGKGALLSGLLAGGLGKGVKGHQMALTKERIFAEREANQQKIGALLDRRLNPKPTAPTGAADHFSDAAGMVPDEPPLGPDLSLGGPGRFKQAFGKQADNAPVYEPGSETSSRVEMNRVIPKLVKERATESAKEGAADQVFERSKLISPKLARLGKGKTLPFYPRGGAAEQAIPPSPASSGAAPFPVKDIKTAIEMARAHGTPEKDIAAELARRGISPDQVHTAMGTK